MERADSRKRGENDMKTTKVEDVVSHRQIAVVPIHELAEFLGVEVPDHKLSGVEIIHRYNHSGGPSSVYEVTFKWEWTR